MKYSIKFNLDKKLHQIYLFFNYEGDRFKYYTGCRIEPAKWDTEKQRVKPNNVNEAGQSASVINRELDKIYEAITSIYNTHYFLKLKISLPELKEQLKIELGKSANDEKDLFSYFEKYIKNAKVSVGSRDHLKVTYNHFKRFCGNDSINFENITPETLEAFQKHLESEKNKGSNTITCNLKRLRNFFSYANDKKQNCTSNDPFREFKIKPEKYGKPIYLTKEERDQIYNADLTSNPRLQNIRDIFIFQCLIGTRVGDMVQLTHDNIINGSITYIPNKTKDEKPEPITIPLNGKAKAILSRYNLPDGKLLPFITDQRYNDYIKELFVFVGITRKVVRLNPKTGNNEIVRICDIASSHMARRTFIGVMHALGKKDDVIGSMSGHTKGSKAFGRYYDVSENLKQDAIKDSD
jgi:integrase